MPRVKALTAAERQRRELVAAIFAGMIRKGLTKKDVAAFFPGKSEKTFERRLKEPGKFTFEEMCVLSDRLDFNDAQWSLIFGRQYHGSTRI